MSDNAHRGSRVTGPFTQTPDRRILELDEAVRTVEVSTGAAAYNNILSDPTRSAANRLYSLRNTGQFARGIVVQALPSVNWYKVQAGSGIGWVSACFMANTTMLPLGPRTLGMVAPNDEVLIYKPQGSAYAYIVGVVPPFTTNGNVLVPDWILQGSGGGLRRESGHSYPIKNLYKGGSVLDWNAQRPQDQTGAEQGWITSFGLALTIDNYLIQMRVNEMAGLWMSYFDGWVRLAGEQLTIESTAHELTAGDDEGETSYFLGIATYPHEALGQYNSGQSWTKSNSDQAIQYSAHEGKLDLVAQNLSPFYRYREYGGYLGQGHLRMVVAPPTTQQERRLGDTAQDNGLWLESIALDGSYTVTSAKSISFSKRSRIPVPREKALATSQQGDSAATGNYKFSSLHGSGPEHKVGTPAPASNPRSLLRAAATLDFIANEANWKTLHPFYYHRDDYDTPQAQAGETLRKNQESVDFGILEDKSVVTDPEPVQLKIDHRYGDAEYFERESFIRLHDDGSIHISGGAGEEIVLAGGAVYINAPGGIHIRPGTDFTVHADQAVIKAKSSIDLSATEKDIRIKAEGNMQFVAGNAGEGGMLFESRGTGDTQEYDGKYGDEVKANGIVFKAAKSVIGLLSKDIYLRTGGGDLEEGDILFDASQGKRRVQIYAQEFHTYVNKAITFNFGPLEEESTVSRAYYFGEDSMIADVRLLLGGRLIGYNGGGGSAGIVVDGGVYGTGSFATSGVMADSKGMFLGKVPGGFASTITASTDNAATAAKTAKQEGETRHQSSIVTKYYQGDKLGDAALITAMQFSFRDPPGDSSQYNTSDFQWPECRWQQMVRFGLGSGGQAWTEKPVIYQGEETYPWPGKKQWVDNTNFLQLDALTMYDAASGVDKDRPGPYEEPKLGMFEKTTADGNYKLIR